MDAITAALITAAGPALAAAAIKAWRSWLKRRARRRRIEHHVRIIADSLLLVTMRTDELMDRLDAIELALHLPAWLRPEPDE